MAKDQPNERIQSLLKEVVEHFDREDSSVRERQIRTARRLKLLWDGYSQIWYSEIAHDWRLPEQAESGDDQNYYDKPVNVFRAYLESIIAALSVTVPPVKCYPDDADNTLDLATAKAGDKISALIYRHNDVSLLWLHALFIFCTEGMVACYSYPKADVKYGTYKVNKEEDTEEMHQYTKCPNCGFVIDDQQMTPEMMQAEAAVDERLDLNEDKFAPGNEDIGIQGMADEDPELCPSCMSFIAPQLSNEQLVITRIVGTTNEPKSRICLEAYGLLYVKIANYAKKPEDTPYLIYSYETHYANVIERFSHLHKDLHEKLKASSGPSDPYDEGGRLNLNYQGEYPENNITVKNAWLRPAAFNVLDEEDAKELRKLYPNGAKVALAADMFAEACNESLDDSWTLTINPLSDYLVHDPNGTMLIGIQEITNDLISLVLQTIEHGIGQTFADPGVLNFDAYRKMEAIPGGVYEATPKSGKSLQESFHEMKTASLSPEIMPFGTHIQSMGQLVSGALPSLFGGVMGGGGETASQYSMSKAQALQRQQNTWKIFTTWWKTIYSKVVPMYIKEVKDDERDVMRGNDGNFINVLIRKSELEGKIGKVELEANENLPMTWGQIKDAIMALMEINNPEILAILGAPENLPIIREAIGLVDFYVPGEDDRNKQYDEIKLLLNSAPMPTGDPMNPEMPSIEVDPIFDNNEIEFEVVRKWVISEAGRQAKIENPEGHANVMLHGKMHFMFMQQQQMAEQQAPGEKPKEDTETPIKDESNVSATA